MCLHCDTSRLSILTLHSFRAVAEDSVTVPLVRVYSIHTRAFHCPCTAECLQRDTDKLASQIDLAKDRRHHTKPFKLTFVPDSHSLSPLHDARPAFHHRIVCKHDRHSMPLVLAHSTYVCPLR